MHCVPFPKSGRASSMYVCVRARIESARARQRLSPVPCYDRLLLVCPRATYLCTHTRGNVKPITTQRHTRAHARTSCNCVVMLIIMASECSINCTFLDRRNYDQKQYKKRRRNQRVQLNTLSLCVCVFALENCMRARMCIVCNTHTHTHLSSWAVWFRARSGESPIIVYIVHKHNIA